MVQSVSSPHFASGSYSVAKCWKSLQKYKNLSVHSIFQNGCEMHSAFDAARRAASVGANGFSMRAVVSLEEGKVLKPGGDIDKTLTPELRDAHRNGLHYKIQLVEPNFMVQSVSSQRFAAGSYSLSIRTRRSSEHKNLSVHSIFQNGCEMHSAFDAARRAASVGANGFSMRAV